MKWVNRGHEFDNYKDIFKKGKKLIIYGEGVKGKELFESIKFVDCVEGFIDNSLEKQGKDYCGIPVFSVLDSRINPDRFIVVVTVDTEQNLLMQQMRTLGFRDGISLFNYSAFFDFYLPLYMWFGWGKVYFHSVGITLTTKCNFNCYGCLAFIPKNKFPTDYNCEMFLDSIDLLFKYVDHVDIFQLSGGETFLYKDQKVIIDYIGEKYRERINHLYTTTNGSVMPSKELIESLKKNCVTVIADDYTKSVHEYKNKFSKNLSLLTSNGVQVFRNEVENWIDITPLDQDDKHLSEDELIRYYGACSQPWIELFEGKLYSCNYANYAMRAKLIDEDSNDYIDLSKGVDPVSLIEFRMGFTEKGYVDFCRLCNGYVAINNYKITPAVQVKR